MNLYKDVSINIKNLQYECDMVFKKMLCCFWEQERGRHEKLKYKIKTSEYVRGIQNENVIHVIHYFNK